MDVLRARAIARLKEHDRYDRLRIYYPHIQGLGEDCISVHAKLMIIDERLARVGSSNTSNRSMGLDTECDLAIEATAQKKIGKAIHTLLNRLLGEHLDVAPEIIAQQIQSEQSLVHAIEALRGNERTLQSPRAD